jgi:hypothetical protein
MLDAHQNQVSKTIGQQAAAPWATSSRNPERHHPGLPGRLRRNPHAGHFRLRLIEFTPTRLVFEIDRADHKHVEVTYDLDATRVSEVQGVVHLVFGVQD